MIAAGLEGLGTGAARSRRRCAAAGRGARRGRRRGPLDGRRRQPAGRDARVGGLASRGRGPDGLLAALRAGDPAVIGRIEDGGVVLDLRTVEPADDAALAASRPSARRAVAARRS